MEQASAIPESNKMSEQQLKQVSTEQAWAAGAMLENTSLHERSKAFELHAASPRPGLPGVPLVPSMLLTAQQLTDWQASHRLACAGPIAQALTDPAAHGAVPGRELC